ncbi:hypothetical protein ABZ793_33045 [Micromonospora sp. NPDC047465]|uniref:hypothetical protein n=1 Tax=Micromonospora sp. NPDC047465 TaxID=3154813 RepID=UPI0033F6D14D
MAHPTHRPADKTVVKCIDCGVPCVTPVSRARRIGSSCWRKRRAIARRQAAAAASSTLPTSGQDGPSLLDDLIDQEVLDGR